MAAAVFLWSPNHDGADIGSGTGADGSPGGFSGRIQHAGKPQKDAGAAFLSGKRQHPERLIGKLCDGAADGGSGGFGERYGFSVFQNKAAQGQDHIRCALAIGTDTCAVCDGDRHLPRFAVEWLYVLHRVCAEQCLPGDAALFCCNEKRCLCGIACGRPYALFYPAAAVALGLLLGAVYLGSAAKCAADEQLPERRL